MDGYQYVLELVDQMSGPAKTAGQQIQSLTSSLQKESSELQKLQKRYEDLNKAEVVDIKTAKALQSQIAGKQSKIDSLGGSIRQQVTQQKQANHAAEEGTSSFGALSSTLGAMAPYIAAAAIALAGLVVGGLSIALSAQHFKTNTEDALKMTLGTQQAAESTFEAIRAISDDIGIKQERAESLGLSLLDAGVKQAQLGDAIKSIALLEKVRGTDAANKLQGLIEKTAAAGSFQLSAKGLTGTGLSEVDVINQLAKDTGKSVAQLKVDLAAGKVAADTGIKAIQEVLTKKLGTEAGGFETVQDGLSKIYEMFTRLFDGVDPGPLLAGLKEIAGWLSESTVAGNAMKWLFTTVFQGILDILVALIPYAKTGFLELVIIGLKIYIAFKPLLAAIKELGSALGVTGDSGDTMGKLLVFWIDAVSIYVRIAIADIKAIVEVITFVVEAFEWLYDVATLVLSGFGNEIDLVVAGFGLMMAVVSLVSDGIVAEFDAVEDALSSIFSGENGADLAMSLVNGLIGGLAGGTPQVVDAMTQLGSDALAGVKDILGIHSPSTEMADVADDTVDGFTNQVDDRNSDAQAAIASVVTPPDAPGGGAGSAAGGSPVQITIEAGAIVIQSSTGNAQEIAEAVEAKLVDILESFAMQFGGAAPAADPS